MPSSSELDVGWMVSNLEHLGARGVFARAASVIRASRFRSLCVALGDVVEHPYADQAAFRTPARIFATLAPDASNANVRLPRDVQKLLVESRASIFARVSGAWGIDGWTRMDLRTVDDATANEVLREAHALAQNGAKKTRRTTKRR